ncbi:MAG: VOC family protein [Acidaminococcaceae bacterium]|nr:VOC family protein [Acidaminococcaceae bacterium]MBQ9698316.1 VOC family protein [Acidaminococcaceae bacterium]MBR1591212.1 VOC family protein [Acidaminococcaceae bacterium]
MPAAEKPVPGSLDLCFETEDDIEEVYAELQRKNAPLVTGIVNRNGAKGKMHSVYLRDPDGNLVELASYK